MELASAGGVEGGSISSEREQTTQTHIPTLQTEKGGVPQHKLTLQGIIHVRVTHVLGHLAKCVGLVLEDRPLHRDLHTTAAVSTREVKKRKRGNEEDAHSTVQTGGGEEGERASQHRKKSGKEKGHTKCKPFGEPPW